MSSLEPLSLADQATLLEVAGRAIDHGVRSGGVMEVDASQYPASLAAPERGCFVTLRRGGELRGCVGALRSQRPLVNEVARSAHMAALRDPRFPPLKPEEREDLHIHISVLSVPEALPVTSEDELVEALRPGVDGVILREGLRVGTFLPDVWESIPDAPDFVRQLKVKAGLAPDHWSSAVRIERYVTQAFG